MQATERLWRTPDGKLVRDGDEAATELAYTPGDQIQPRDESLVPGQEQDGGQPAEGEQAKAAGEQGNKQATKPADKAAPKPADK